jgi:hypothetical protein
VNAATEIEALRRENQRLRTERDEWEALATEFKGLTEEWQARADALEAGNQELMKALEPFADAADYYSNGIHRPVAEDALPCGPALLVRHLRRARALTMSDIHRARIKPADRRESE